MTFQEKIDFLMKKHGIKSLRDLAKEVGLAYTTLWDYYSYPERLDKAGITKVKKISKRLKCTLDYLAYDEITDPNMTAPELFESLEHSNVIPDDNKFSIEIKSNVPFEELNKEEQQEYIDEAMERLLLMKKANKQKNE